MDKTEEAIISHFKQSPVTDYWGTHLTEAHVREYFTASRERFDIVANHVIHVGGKRVAEIGPAYGAISLKLKAAGMDVTAYEMPEGIDAYTDVLRTGGVPIIPWDIHLSDAEGNFDVVVASEVIEHLQISVASAVKKLARLLRPGGRLIVSVPNAYNLPNIVRILRGHNIQEPFTETAAIKNGIVIDSRVHPREPVMRDMIDAMQAAGLTAKHRSYFNTIQRPAVRRLAYSITPNCFKDHILIDAQSRL